VTVTIAKQAYERMPESRKAIVLAWIIHELTIEARDTYEVGTDGVDDPERLRRFNEVQHRLAGRLAMQISGSTDTMHDHTIIDMLFALGPEGQRAFERGMGHEGGAA
jgi:hypothetical protein